MNQPVATLAGNPIRLATQRVRRRGDQRGDRRRPVAADDRDGDRALREEARHRARRFGLRDEGVGHPGRKVEHIGRGGGSPRDLETRAGVGRGTEAAAVGEILHSQRSVRIAGVGGQLDLAAERDGVGRGDDQGNRGRKAGGGGDVGFHRRLFLPAHLCR